MDYQKILARHLADASAALTLAVAVKEHAATTDASDYVYNQTRLSVANAAGRWEALENLRRDSE